MTGMGKMKMYRSNKMLSAACTTPQMRFFWGRPLVRTLAQVSPTWGAERSADVGMLTK